MIVYLFWRGSDSHRSQLLRGHSALLIDPDQSLPLWRNTPGSGGFAIDPHFLRGDIPPSTHTFSLELADKVCGGADRRNRMTVREKFLPERLGGGRGGG